MEERLHMTSQTMVNKVRMTSIQAIIHIKVHMTSSQIMTSSMIPIIKISPIIHKGKITAITHKVRYTDLLLLFFSTYRITCNYLYIEFWIRFQMFVKIWSMFSLMAIKTNFLDTLLNFLDS